MREFGKYIRWVSALAALGTMHWAGAAPGSVDTTFGTGGSVAIAGVTVEAMAVQSDGKIVVGGARNSDGSAIVARFLANGSPDTTFGSGGTAVLAPHAITGIGVQPGTSGKILATQMVDIPIPLCALEPCVTPTVSIVRLMPDGTVDSSYGTPGFYAPDAPNFAFTALSIQPDGSAYLAVQDRFGVIPRNFVVMIGPVAPDATTGGNISFLFADCGDWFNLGAVAVQPDGKIVLGGGYTCATGGPLIRRLNPDASFSDDTAFGINGAAYGSLPAAGGATKPVAMIVQPDGSIVYGSSIGSPTQSFTLMRVTSSGALDATFGTAGMADGGFTDSLGTCCTVLLQSDGKIVAVGGQALHATGIARFLSNGTLDPGFGADGTAFASGSFGAAALQANGRLVVATNGVSGAATLVRFITGYEATSTTTLASNANPSASGQSITFTATVYGGASPAGNVAFLDGGTAIPGCSAQPVSLSHATCTTSTLSVGTHSITASYVDTTGYYAPSTSSPLPQQVNLIVANVDFNGDGHPDILWSNTASGATYVWYMGGTPPALITDAFIAQIDPSWQVQGIADFNSDGHPDLVWRNTTNGDCYVWYMNGATFMSDAYLFSLPPQWVIQGVADFNGDGKPDFFMRNTDPASGVGFAWYFDNATAIGSDFLFGIDPVWKVEQVGDLNGDGQPDLLFRNMSSGLSFGWFTQYSGGVLSLAGSTPPLYSIDPVWEVMQLADWNGDGKPDLLFRNATSGLVFVWYLNTDNTLGSSDFIIQIDPSWEIVPRR